MAERMIGVRVAITRYISDDPQPGIVECELLDANSRRWIFVEKAAIVFAGFLDARTNYPQPGVIACEIISRSRDATGREIIEIDTERSDGVESLDGSTRFQVVPGSLIEWNWGSNVERPWDGRA